MIVWGFFSAMGWMTANWAVEKYATEKSKEPVPIIQQETPKREDQKTSP